MDTGAHFLRVARDSLGAWLPFVDAYRTFLINPGIDGRRVLEQLTGLPMSA